MTESIERALVFEAAGESLVGILHPSATPSSVGVVLIVGGPQYRAGSHRQFVLLARALARAGFVTLRFDSRGMGDSSGEPASFTEAGPDIGAAIDTLIAQEPCLERVVLWGLCDAASAALLYLDSTADPRVGGLCLLNPYVRSEQSLAKTHVRHYYVQRLRDRSFWAKLLRGGIGVGAARGLMTELGLGMKAEADDDSFRTRMRRAWAAYRGDILLVLSGDDLTAREFADALRDDVRWRRAIAQCQPTTLEIRGADHTFSDNTLRTSLEVDTVRWLQTLSARSLSAPLSRHGDPARRYSGVPARILDRACRRSD